MQSPSERTLKGLWDPATVPREAESELGAHKQMKGLRAFQAEGTPSTEVERGEGVCQGAGIGHVRSKGQGEAAPKATLCSLCSPEPRCALQRAGDLGPTQTQWHHIGTWHMGRKPFFILLADARAGHAGSAHGCQVDLRIQEGAQCT